MSRRADRWWRPATTRRPAQRARQRRMYSGSEFDGAYDTGYAGGYADGVRRRLEANHYRAPVAPDEDLDELLRRAREADPERFHQIAEAVREGGDAVQRLAREWGVFPDGDDLLGAPVAGVTPVSPGCRPWCTVDHTDPKEQRSEAVTEMRQHVQVVAVIDRDGETVAQVEIVAVDDLGSGRPGPAEVMLVDAKDTYSPDEADRIAAAVVEAGRIIREQPVDNLLDVADAAGVTPLADIDPGDLVADLEVWLHEQGGGE